MKNRDWLDVWFVNYIKPSSKAKTCERYSEIVEKHLKIKLGDYELEDLTPIVIQKYITELMQSSNLTTGKGLAANSVNGTIGGFFYAKKRRNICKITIGIFVSLILFL